MAAIAVGLVLAVGTGPLGRLVGVPETVFLLELYRNGESKRARRAVLMATVGIFASALVQVLLTTTLLIGFAFVVLLQSGTTAVFPQ